MINTSWTWKNRFDYFSSMSSRLFIIFLKLLPILPEQEVNHSIVIRHYNISFWSSAVKIRVSKIKVVEYVNLLLWQLTLKKKLIEQNLHQSVRIMSHHVCQHYQTISKKLVKWRKSINWFHVNSVNVKEKLPKQRTDSS